VQLKFKQFMVSSRGVAAICRVVVVGAGAVACATAPVRPDPVATAAAAAARAHCDKALVEDPRMFSPEVVSSVAPATRSYPFGKSERTVVVDLQPRDAEFSDELGHDLVPAPGMGRQLVAKRRELRARREPHDHREANDASLSLAAKSSPAGIQTSSCSGKLKPGGITPTTVTGAALSRTCLPTMARSPANTRCQSS